MKRATVVVPEDVYREVVGCMEEARNQLERGAALMEPYCLPYGPSPKKTIAGATNEVFAILSSFRRDVESIAAVAGMRVIDSELVFPVRIVRRSKKHAEDFIVAFCCPCCQMDHEHEWGVYYPVDQPKRVPPGCPVSGSPLDRRWHQIELDEESRAIVGQIRREAR